MLFKGLVISLAVTPFLCLGAIASSGKPPIRYTILFNDDIRHADENFYANRLEVFFIKEINPSNGERVSLRAVPFLEARHSVKRRKRERVSTGVELGLGWRDFFYLGQQFRQVWRSEPVYDRGVIKNTNMFETVSIVTLSRRLIPAKDILKGYISGEYTYDFRLGRGTRIESIAGLLIPVAKEAELNLDWRHRDRIHSDDCDTFELSASYKF